ncbi:membrane fusion protein (multidrug efflux system) [Sphingomonas vulcanisoli]|uniref:Membrane fusion protein (Multidrug efflux system) n=1 Tax=Sphingomonas vulcanisoli TaxID=1658060 RepID=A0ABX0TQA1_9SPHN|nr:HlyD family secretion protein [Sphingomonas vulcanisoli]NIJ07704.1 membrane fusion protein (multidrug efflux system) [Sphingomonas vulcanisoli]
MAEELEAAASEPEKRKRLSANARRGLLAGAVLVALLILAWVAYYMIRGKYYEGTNDAYLQADAVTVSSKVSGYVDQVYVVDNQDVTAGQPLVHIDPRDYSAQTAQFQAQIDLALASAANVRAGISEQQAAVEQARAQLAANRSDLAFAQDEVARYTPLAQSGAETREKLQSLRNTAARAANAVAASTAALDAAELRIGSLKAQGQQAQAQREAAVAQRGAANVNLASTIIRAAIPGRVGNKSVQQGQFVQPGLRLMSVVPLQSIYITANFKETQVGLMRPGQPAEIKLDALPGTTLHGHVQSIAPGTGAQFSLLPPQNATGNFTKIVQRVPVRIAIDVTAEERARLVPGYSAKVTVDTYAAKHDPDQTRGQ